MTKATKAEIFKTIVQNIMTYGAKTWEMTKKEKRQRPFTCNGDGLVETK